MSLVSSFTVVCLSYMLKQPMVHSLHMMATLVMEQFLLSDDRTVIVRKVDDQCLFVVKQKDEPLKFTQFTPSRWARFRHCIEYIDLGIITLCNGNRIEYKEHIGDGYYVSISTGIYCVDVRKFFKPDGQEILKPTRHGLAFRILEWASIKKIIDKINSNYPDLGTSIPCSYGDDHLNQLQYRECHPFNALVECTVGSNYWRTV